MTTRFIPFREDMAAAIIAGKKTMTTRTKRYGNDGDVLDSPAGKLRLTRVSRVKLGRVAKTCYKAEGLPDQAAFEKGWAELHPRKGYDPDQMVYLHAFELMKE